MTNTPHPEWMSEEALHTLSAGYLLPGETPRDMMTRLSSTAAKLNQDPTLEEDLFHCLWNGFIGPASPVCSNFGTNRGQPISCFSIHLTDSISSIYSHLKEVASLSKNGGGVGVYFGDVRPAGTPISGGGKSTGIVPWARQYDLCASVVSQGGVRRGSFAMYLPISHPDVPEILRAKDHANGDSRQKIDSNIALTITDEWIESMIAGNKEKQELFGEVLKTRMISGSPYLIFIDNANNQNPACYVERGLTVKTSNLCSEVFLHTDENHSFVCVLSSLNLSKYDEFKDWRSPVSGRSVPQIAVHLLESVVSEFIRKAKDKVGMGRSVRFAEKSRALGLGVMGLHTLYQKRGLPFKSQEARELNTQVHKWILQEAETASRELAVKLGEPEWCVGSGKRHTHLLAVAPTKTNSVICGAGSEGIEPIASNYFVAKQAKGSYVRKNPILESLLCKKGVGPEVWDEILEARGSVQGLACLTDKEKEVFKTAREVDQFELVKQAADRQPFICQGQSLNLFVDPEADADYIMRLHLSAWKMGLKSLYYLKSSSLLTKKKKAPALIVTKEGCPWCDSLKQELYLCGITYKEMDKQEAIDKGYWNHDWKTVPQLWLYDKHIGGYTEYMQYKEENSVLKFNLPTETTPEYTDCTACEA
jgi:ribonucleoside-diphosphate reductase alpha chain